MTRKKRILFMAQKLVPPAIDFSMLAAVLFTIPWLGGQIYSQEPINHVLFLPGFFLLIAGVIAIRSLPTYIYEKDEDDPRYIGAFLGFFLAIIYSLFYAHATNIGGYEQNNDAMAVVIFFIFIIPFITSFAWPIKNSKPGTIKALAAKSISLISVNYLTLVGAAAWYHFNLGMAGDDPVYATGIWFLILYAILYLLFLAFFGLPRLFLLSATNDKIGFAAYLIAIAIFLWDKVPPIG